MIGLTEDDSDLFLILFFITSLILFAFSRYWRKKDTADGRINSKLAMFDGLILLLLSIYLLIRLIITN